MGKFDDPISTLPEQIATSLVVDQDLPQLIADRIAASTLAANTGASTATQIEGSTLAADTALEVNTVGVPVIDKPDVLILNRAHNLLNNTSTNDVIADTTKYQSLIVELDFASGHGTVLPGTARFWRVDIAWSNGESAGFGGLKQTVYFHGDDDGGVASVRVPALGTSCTITYYNHVGITYTAIVTVVGSLRPVNRVTVNQRVGTGAPWLSGIGNDASALHLASDPANPVVVGAGVLAPLPPRAGVLEVTLSPVQATTATTQGRFALLDHNGLRMCPVVRPPVSSPAVDAVIQLSARQGYHPAFIWCDTVPSGVTSAHLSASWQDAA